MDGTQHSENRDEVERELRERARRLARPPETGDDGEASVHLVEFRLGSDRYATGLKSLRGVFVLETFVPLPGTPPFVLGISLFRGAIVSVLDIRQALGLDAREEVDLENWPSVVVLGSPDMTFGLIADEVLGMRAIPKRDIQKDVVVEAIALGSCVSGVARDGTIVLDGEALLASPDLVVHGDR